MKEGNKKFNSVDEYFSSLSTEKQIILTELRNIIKQAAPEAEEVISYNMPAIKFHGILVYYAAFKDHISFFPGGSFAIKEFKEELKDFETSEGTIKFPLNQKLPKNIITKIVKLRIKQNSEKVKTKK